jgi:hypothetical protein
VEACSNEASLPDAARDPPAARRGDLKSIVGTNVAATRFPTYRRRVYRRLIVAETTAKAPA